MALASTVIWFNLVLYSWMVQALTYTRWERVFFYTNIITSIIFLICLGYEAIRLRDKQILNNYLNYFMYILVMTAISPFIYILTIRCLNRIINFETFNIVYCLLSACLTHLRAKRLGCIECIQGIIDLESRKREKTCNS